MTDYIFKPSTNGAGNFSGSLEFEGLDPSETVPVADGTYDIYEKVVASFQVARITAELSLAAVGEEPVILATAGAVPATISSGPYAGTYTQRVTDGAPLSIAMIEAAPTPIVLPVISGSISPGQTLTATPGIWLYAGADPGDQSFAWYSDTGGALGVTELSYTLQASDLGATLYLEETFTGLTISSASTGVIGTAQAVPDAFADANWSVATGVSPGTLDITVASLPANNGSAITDIEYDVDASGVWISLGRATPGTTTRAVPAPATSYAIRLRAINSEGAGDAGNTESAISGAAPVAGPSPADYSETLHWWSFKLGEGGLYQDSNKATPVDAAGQTIRAIEDQVGAVDLVNPVGDNTYGAGDEAVLSGTNNCVYATSASLSLPNPCIVLATLRTTDAAFLLVSKSTSAFAGVAQSGSGAAPGQNMGAPLYHAGAGATALANTRGAIHAAWATGAWTVCSIRNLGFGGASGSDFFDYSNTGLATSGEVKDLVFVDAAISNSDLDDLITDMEARAA